MKWFLIILFSVQAFALQTQYVSFEQPDSWKCELNQGVYICQGTHEPERKESIVLSVATIAGEWDSLDAYEKYLKTPRTIVDDTGGELEAKITYTRRRNINGVTWIDSLQYNSEIPGFWARYTATVQNKLAILITYIVSDEYYSKMAPKFEKMISSLKPNSEFESALGTKQSAVLPGNTPLGPLIKDRVNLKKTAPAEPNSKPDESNSENSPDNSSSLAILVAAAALITLLVIRILKGKKKGGASSIKKGVKPSKKP